jgi:hypothetical protein
MEPYPAPKESRLPFTPTEDWSAADEEVVWKTWTKADQFLLEQLEDVEGGIWDQSRRMFDCRASDLLPPDLVANPLGLQPVAVTVAVESDVQQAQKPQTTTVYLEDLNWGQVFCNRFKKLLCCPAFF